MTKKLLIFLTLAMCVLQAAACRRPAAPSFGPADFQSVGWDELERRARGATVNFAMWAGDEERNTYYQTKVTSRLKEKFGVTLHIIPLGDTADAITKLLNEKGAGKTSGGSVDMLWINGENFRTAKRAQILWGAFAERLPNARLYAPPAAERDFGTKIDGLEAPWQRAQFVLAHDTARTPDPPRSISALGEWIKRHPGRFTYPAPPDFTGSVFLRHVLFHFGGGAQNFQDEFNSQTYERAATAAFEFLNDIKPFLWRKGETYPTSPTELDRLFANGEIDFAMSYAPNFASDRIRRGEYPPTARTFVFDAGTIGNYSYLTIPFNATNPAAALVVINYLMSHEHLLEQSQELMAVYPHDPAQLTPAQRDAVRRLPRGEASLTEEELSSHLAPEADAGYLEKLEKDWRERVLQQ
jgi:putative spermidine/putrescine transport system substrate-binding protein